MPRMLTTAEEPTAAVVVETYSSQCWHRQQRRSCQLSAPRLRMPLAKEARSESIANPNREKKRRKKEGSSSGSGSGIEGVLSLIERSKRVVVVTGAGISVSCGIPDFRSKETGLYNSLDCAALGIPSAELLFDISFFRIDPQPFFSFAKALLPLDAATPSYSHRFIRLLERKRRLLRNYSQNVDGLEAKAGISRFVACHGSLDAFTCQHCGRVRKADADIMGIVADGKIPYCLRCRPKEDLEGTNVLKPNIVFFGERVASSFETCMRSDVDNGACDLVLVIGTSLKVGGSVLELMRQLDEQGVPKVLINREAVSAPGLAPFTAALLGSCDGVLEFVSSQLGWEEGSGTPVGGAWKVVRDADSETTFQISHPAADL